jgi:hypothetical protein
MTEGWGQVRSDDHEYPFTIRYRGCGVTKAQCEPTDDSNNNGNSQLHSLPPLFLCKLSPRTITEVQKLEEDNITCSYDHQKTVHEFGIRVESKILCSSYCPKTVLSLAVFKTSLKYHLFSGAANSMTRRSRMAEEMAIEGDIPKSKDVKGLICYLFRASPPTSDNYVSFQNRRCESIGSPSDLIQITPPN